MANINNYAASDYKYTEIIKALEDYDFNTYVKCATPSIMALLPKSAPISTPINIDTSNILNKNAINVGTFNSCNYMEIYIPSVFSNGNSSGKKGDEFVITFVGGDVNDILVIGRHING